VVWFDFSVIPPRLSGGGGEKPVLSSINWTMLAVAVVGLLFLMKQFKGQK